jgi:hypothetical protein
MLHQSGNTLENVLLLFRDMKQIEVFSKKAAMTGALKRQSKSKFIHF